MSKEFLLILILSLMLMACKQNKPSTSADDSATVSEEAVQTVEESEAATVYDTKDAHTFGLMGNVQSVSTQSFLTTDVNGNLVEGAMVAQSEMTFDQWGHVTKDEWGNEYGYDADGNYYRGNHAYTLLKRNESGRIKEYIDEEPDTDNQENQKIVFDYDKNGRLEMVTQSGWSGHWQEERVYEGTNLYPSKIVTSADYEGGGSNQVTMTFRYSRYDEKKNWIERLCIISAENTELSLDTLPDETKIEEQIRIEKRNITYY